jgi:endoglucanase
MPRMKTLFIALVLGLLAMHTAKAEARWPLWDSYKARFLDQSGRIMDHDADDRTTSEGQSYALFFSLVANDRASFDRVLSWTQTNIAKGDIATNLPAWLWDKQHGTWQVADSNSASDSDLWIAYTLLEAGRHWGDHKLSALGNGLANVAMQREVSDIAGLGPMLLPGPRGFRTSDGWYQLNASYLPVQLLLGISQYTGEKRWRKIAEAVPAVLEGSLAKGFILDWIAYRPENGFAVQPSPVPTALASYDAIRVYLWAGMLANSTPGHDRILKALSGMAIYVDQHGVPPAGVNEMGTVVDAHGNVGFSAAVIPLLSALGCREALAKQMTRMRSDKNEEVGLYGTAPRYYDQNLALFALGWYEKRFHFDEQGQLGVSW